MKSDKPWYYNVCYLKNKKKANKKKKIKYPEKINSWKIGEVSAVHLLNFEGGKCPGVRLLNFTESRLPPLSFEGDSVSRVLGSWYHF